MPARRRAQHLPLQGTDLVVSPLILGCFGMSGGYGPRDEAESIRAIHAAVDGGINVLDTADFYGWGHNETLVGKALRGLPPDVLLASKLGFVQRNDGVAALCATPSHVQAACEASLKRLRREHLDLLYLHRVDPSVPIEDTVGAMADLARAGKVRHLGLCEVAPETLARACAVHPIAALQSEYSLLSRGAEDEVFAACDRLGVHFFAFSPLGRGLLTGAIRSTADLAPDDIRRGFPRFGAGNLERNLILVEELAQIGRALQCSPSQLAIAWAVAKGGARAAVVGGDRIEHVEQAVGALNIAMPSALRERISGIFSAQRVAGERYPAGAAYSVDDDSPLSAPDRAR
ncbi:MAG: aldo/keto reductase [Burkholderiaceae bacterium]|nr:aldo/keto reductase [Burkholderiaceae bacterium]